MNFDPALSSAMVASTSASSVPASQFISLFGNVRVASGNVSSPTAPSMPPLFVYYQDNNQSSTAVMNNNQEVTKIKVKSVTTVELLILASVISMALILLIGAFVYFVSIYFKKKGRSKSFDLDKSRREAEAAEHQISRNQLTIGPNGEFISGPKWCCAGAAESVPLDFHCGRDCKCGWLGMVSCMRSCGSYNLDVPGDGCC